MWHPEERAALVTALREAGPGAPTLPAGWRTEHLAAHVVLRESTVLTAAGIAVPPLAARTERRTQELADRSTTPSGWAALLERVAAGPPRWHPLRWAGDGPQLAELFVHTEDVRRAGPGTVEPRVQEPAHTDALWRALTTASRFALRRSPVPLVLRRTDGPVVTAGPREGPAPVTVEGDPGELLLWTFDRPHVARVRLDGEAGSIARLARFREPATA